MQIHKLVSRYWLAMAIVLPVDAGVFVPSMAAGGDEPAPPPGFSSRATVMLAIQTGKLKLVDPNIPVPDSVEFTEGVEYGKGGGESLKLDLYRPKQLAGRVPGLVMIHGGAWRGGKRSDYRYYCVKLAEKGYVAATVSYRLTRVAPFPAAVEDVKCAVRWMCANADRLHVDPDKIGVVGASAGGHLAMMVGYLSHAPKLEGRGGHADVSSRVQAVVNFYGPADLTMPSARDMDVVRDFVGGETYDEAPQRYKQASPIHHVTTDDPPTLVLHGTIDAIVPIEQSDALTNKLKETGVCVEYERLDGWPHAMDVAEDVNRRCLYRMNEFLRKYLPLPNSLSDDQRLRGTWEIVELNGKTDTPMQGLRFVFADGRITVIAEGVETAGFKYEIAPDRQPKQLDMFVGGDGEAAVSRGIYTIERDHLRVCSAGKPGRARLTAFRTVDDSEGAEQNVFVFKKREGDLHEE